MEWQKSVDDSVAKAKKLMEKFTKKCEQEKVRGTPAVKPS